MLRKILVGAGLLVALLVSAAIAFVMLFDVNRLKPTIEGFVQERYQRNLQIDGDVRLAVFPRIALSLPRSVLSERGGAGEAASVTGARVAVSIMPLLRGEVVADKVTVEGLKAIVERRADGSLSIDDLTGAGATSTGTNATGAPAAPGRQLPRLDLAGIRVAGGQVTYRDQQTGGSVTLNDIEMDTGRIANKGATPLALKLAFTSTSPQASGSLELKAQAQVDFDLKVYGASSVDATLRGAGGKVRLDTARVRLTSLSVDPNRMTTALSGLDIDARGTLGEDAFEAKVSAPRLALTETAVSGDALEGAVKLSGSRSLEASMAGSGLGGSTRALTLDRLSFAAISRQGVRSVQAKLASPAAADLPAGVFQMPGLAGTVVIEDPALPQKTTSIELTGAASADTQKETASVNLDAKSQGTTLLAKVDVNGFSRPGIGFELSAGQLDLDRYFPATRPAPAPGAAGTGPATGAPGATGAAGAAGASGADDPLDLSLLADLDLAGNLSIGQLQARGVRLSDLKIVLKASKGRLDAAPITAALYGGRLAAATVVSAGASPSANRVGTKAELTGISIGPLLRDFARKDLLEGQGNLNLVLNGGGGTAAAIARSLDGSAALALRNGAIKGINLGETIRSARNLLRTGGKTETTASDARKQTDFTELDVSFVIADGIATSNDLDVKSPLLRLGGDGRADLVSSRLDYTLRASVVGTSRGQGGKDLDDVRGVTIPVKVVGPFDKLDWQIDWETTAREALKSRATAEIKERLKTDDIEGKAREKLG
ncbi:MAG TPA: AsmA family protein, partial [Lautropia sp.]|nr:AsmA family protein [Lautropia sp.]